MPRIGKENGKVGKEGGMRALSNVQWFIGGEKKGEGRRGEDGGSWVLMRSL